MFGTHNDRIVKGYAKRVKAINALEEKYANLSDDDLKSEFKSLRERVSGGESLESVLNESFAITREASKRVLNACCYGE